MEKNPDRFDPPPKSRVAGTPIRELWKRKGDAGEEELIPLDRLSHELRKRGIIDKSAKTLYEYTKKGLRHHRSREIIYLRKTYLGSSRHSSVRWFREFLEAHNGTLDPDA